MLFRSRSGFSPWKRSFCSSGQDRNKTVSCCGHRHHALIARRGFANGTCRWQCSGHRLTSGTLGDGRFQALKGGGDQGWRRDGPLESMEGSNQAGPGHGPLDRWKGQTKLAHGMVRWIDGRVKTKLADGMIRWTDGGSNQAGGRHGPLDRWKGQTKLAAGIVR